MKIKLKTIDEVKLFNIYASKLNSVIKVCSGDYTIDGKSIMGIFSLDLSNVLTIIVEDVEEEKELARQLEELGVLV